MLRCARDTVMTARPRSLAEPREGVGGEAAARVERGGARLHLGDPGLVRRARRGRQLGELGLRTGEILLRRLAFETRRNRGGVGAGDLIGRTHAHALLGIALQPLEEAL